MYAVEKGNKDIVELLIKKGADVDKKSNNGKTALYYVKEIYIESQNSNSYYVYNESKTKEAKTVITDLLKNPHPFNIG